MNDNTKTGLSIRNSVIYIHNILAQFPPQIRRKSAAFAQLIHMRFRRFSAPFPHVLHMALGVGFSAGFARQFPEFFGELDREKMGEREAGAISCGNSFAVRRWPFAVAVFNVAQRLLHVEHRARSFAHSLIR